MIDCRLADNKSSVAARDKPSSETDSREAKMHFNKNVELLDTSRLSLRKRWLFLLLLSGCLFCVVETAARIYIPLRGHDLQDVREQYAQRRAKRLRSDWVRQENNHPYLPFHPRVTAPDVEMSGLRLTSRDEVKPPDVFRIFCLGASVTYHGYPAMLEAALSDDFAAAGLRLEVVNAVGVSWSTAESLVNFSLRCVHYEPDAIIVYHGIQDVWPAFGPTYRPDYSHWRKRLVQNEPMVWDHLPRFLDASAGFVQLRAWLEGGSTIHRWTTAMMHYVPDFDRDPYYGMGSFQRNLRSIIGVAQAHGAEVLLSTQVYNREAPQQRFLAAIREANQITRDMAEEIDGVFLIDAAAEIQGDNKLMKDICHFQASGNGYARLAYTLEQAVREHVDTWTAQRRGTPQAPDGPIAHQTPAVEQLARSPEPGLHAMRVPAGSGSLHRK